MNDERWQHVFRTSTDSSFVDLLRRDSPHLMPTPTGGGESRRRFPTGRPSSPSAFVTA
jgi:hypothetical protein